MTFPDNSSLAEKIISESDLKAERLISIFRMALATLLFFGVSFVLFQTQTVGLAARHFELLGLLAGAVCYFVLGALNFYCATSARLKPWMRWMFNFGEVILVSGQLYLDVADPATPSLLAFASPVVLVAVLVICVQVLRFQIRLHIFSTLLLVGLCGLIIFHDPQIGEPLSASALNELQLLYSIPPNIMRLIMLTAMAVLIGTAIYRSKSLIEKAAQEKEVAENRKRFLPVEISDNMSDDGLLALRSGKDKHVAVLFADIRGFTGLSEKIGTRKTADLLTRYRSLIMDTVEPLDGVIDKFIGDGALVIFGLHHDFEKACSNAIVAAEQLENAIDKWNSDRLEHGFEELRLAMGVHAGPAVIGAFGDNRRLEFTALGNTINIAARLEEVAKQQDCTMVISQKTKEHSGLSMDGYTNLGPIPVRGSNEPIEVLIRRHSNVNSTA